MKAYLAGAMTGYPQHNFPLFDHVATELRAAGDEIFNPADLTRDLYGSVDQFMTLPEDEQLQAVRVLLAKELTWIAMWAEGLYLLPGWENSYGARAEHALAAALKLAIIPVPEELLPVYKPD